MIRVRVSTCGEGQGFRRQPVDRARGTRELPTSQTRSYGVVVGTDKQHVLRSEDHVL